MCGSMCSVRSHEPVCVSVCSHHLEPTCPVPLSSACDRETRDPYLHSCLSRLSERREASYGRPGGKCTPGSPGGGKGRETSCAQDRGEIDRE